MINRRGFAAHATGAVGALALTPGLAAAAPLRHLLALPRRAEQAVQRAGATPAEELANDEKFWGEIRTAYALREDVINLDHGWTNPTPAAALAELTRGLHQLQELPAEELPRMWFDVTNQTVRAALA